MKTWFIPSWSGDHRLEEHKDGSVLTVVDPTAGELEILERYVSFARGKGWCGDDATVPTSKDKPLILRAPVATTGLELARLHHAPAADRTITAVRFEDGKVGVATLSEQQESSALAKKADADKDAKAATVKRATPCCPSCEPGAIAPATEVLLSFLDEQQHRDWSKHRVIEVLGGRSGHRYLLAHRHSKYARQWGRICFDADDGQVVHFYDWSTPPEEEVLAAKLVLEHREPWLRNEATCLGGVSRKVYKNPFGGVGDGTETSGFFVGLAGALGSYARMGVAVARGLSN